MIKRICQQCGKEYETYPSIRKQFCSHKCASIAKIKTTTEHCVQCGKPFKKYPSKPNRKYCSKSCARTAANLTEKNPAFHRDITGKNNPMFGVRRCGKDNPMFGVRRCGKDNPMFGKRRKKCVNWKGGRKVRKDGYVLVVAPDDHPHPSDCYDSIQYILEHRLVMEQHIGRYLNPTEVVHHKDKNPSNNNINNLQLFSNHSEHLLKAHKEIWWYEPTYYSPSDEPISS